MMSSKPEGRMQTRPQNATAHPGYIVRDPSKKKKTPAEAKEAREVAKIEKEKIAAKKKAVVERIAELEMAQVAKDMERREHAARPVSRTTGETKSFYF